jgi:hypothetical protein
MAQRGAARDRWLLAVARAADHERYTRAAVRALGFRTAGDLRRHLLRLTREPAYAASCAALVDTAAAWTGDVGGFVQRHLALLTEAGVDLARVVSVAGVVHPFEVGGRTALADTTARADLVALTGATTLAEARRLAEAHRPDEVERSRLEAGGSGSAEARERLAAVARVPGPEWAPSRLTRAGVTETEVRGWLEELGFPDAVSAAELGQQVRFAASAAVAQPSPS